MRRWWEGALRTFLGGDLEEGEPAEPDPELHRLLDLRPWVDDERARYDDSAVRSLLRKNPRAAAARYEFSGRQTWKQYPLKRAVSLGASMDVVRRMAAAHPDAIRYRGVPGTNGYGATPLHAACSYGGSLEVVRFLATRYPEALDMTTRHGYLPLHNACERGASVKVVRLLVEMHPAALDRRNKLGRTPAECALVAESVEESTKVLTALGHLPAAHPTLDRQKGRYLKRSRSWSSRETVTTAETQGLDDSRPATGLDRQEGRCLGRNRSWSTRETVTTAESQGLVDSLPPTDIIAD